MEATAYRWDDVEEDNPIALLSRRRIYGEKAMIAKVHLEKGCVVNLHSHESEQISFMISGDVEWTVGNDAKKIRMKAGGVLVLPSGTPHGVVALEETVFLDVLSPPGQMGVDSQGR